MKRREFLSVCAGFLAGALVGKTSVFSATAQPEADLFKGITIIDAHSHPDEFWSTGTARDFSASFASIKKSGMSACRLLCRRRQQRAERRFLGGIFLRESWYNWKRP